MNNNYTEFLTPQNCAVALIDYQPAMFFGVQSHDRFLTMHNAIALGKTAQLFNLPTVLSTVASSSFSGPMVPEISSIFPNQQIIDRTSINAWVDGNFRKAIEATQRKKIVVAGLWTEACVLFPTLELLKAGYQVYIPTDACGDISSEAHERSVARMIQAGATPINALQFLFELQQDWARSETYNGVMEILKAESPYGVQVSFSHWALNKHTS